MITEQDLANMFAMNLRIIKQQTEGLTHADSVRQPQCGGNCLNWVVGHIVSDRDAVLRTLGEPGILTEAQAKRYGYGSEPVTCDAEGVMQLGTLLGLLERSQPGVEAGLKRINPEDLAKEVKYAGRQMTIAQKLFFQNWHETYHTGQTEQMRQLAGKTEKVI